MNHKNAIEHIAQARRLGSSAVRFVSPIVSTMIACESAGSSGATRFNFEGNAKTYAKTIGLAAVLEGAQLSQNRSGLVGSTYSPLARLAQHCEVEAATDTVAGCLRERMGAGDHEHTVNEIFRVIGELHDNVASHARGAGYSALQVYSRGAVPRVEFAVVDGGVGLLANARCADPAIDRHESAIRWALIQGNTSARAPDAMAQSLPEDATFNPFPPSVPLRFTENHHLGEGLWQLRRLVVDLDGSLWVMTGNADLLVTPENHAGSYRRRATVWSGLAIEVNLPICSTTHSGPDAEDDFARSLGL